MIILSAYQIRHILSKKNNEIKISLDLGMSESVVHIKDQNIVFPDGQKITQDDVKKIMKKDTVCFIIENSRLIKAVIFSEDTNKFYKLVPTGQNTWPTLEISGIRMHVTKSMSPKEDTEKKISYVQPCTGTVLDTCTGLGYTAILASKTAEVYTFEIDKNVIEIQRLNPYSQALFDNPKIHRYNEDIFVAVKKFKDNFFDRIIHDPPRLNLSTLLYSQEFYNECYRVMKKQGKIYHYTGDPGSKKRGLDIASGVIKRMAKSGFKNISRVFNGVTATS
jgi:predicted methyltransferase